METRANYVAVGLLTLVAIIAAFVFIYWLGNRGAGSETAALDVRIRGSVSGLGIGSSVQFNGINVGRVTGLHLDGDDPRFVIARTEVQANLPIRTDTRASIGVRGLSGGAYIQLEGGTPAAQNVFAAPLADGLTIPRVEGDPSSVSELINRVNAIAARTETVMDGLQELVRDNSKGLTATIANAEKFSKALADNSEGVDRLLASAESMARSVETLSSKLDGTIKRAEEIANAIDPAKVSTTVDDLSASASSVRRTLEGLDADKVRQTLDDLAATTKAARELVAGLDAKKVNQTVDDLSATVASTRAILDEVKPETVSKTVNDISETAARARAVMAGVDENAVRSLVDDMSAASKQVSTLLASIDAARINSAMDNFSGAAEGARKAVDDVSKVTSRFGNRAEDIDQMVTDATELAARLNDASKRIDGVISRVDNLLGSGDTNGLMADVRETLAQFRQTARNLDSQIAGVATGIRNFTRSGLGDTQGMINDARQSIQRIDRVIRNLERNPSALISGAGGSSIKESGSRRPRR